MRKMSQPLTFTSPTDCDDEIKIISIILDALYSVLDDEQRQRVLAYVTHRVASHDTPARRDEQEDKG